MTTGLLLIDIQNDYFPGGKMELVGMESAAANAAKLLAGARAAGAPVFHVRHISVHEGATFFLPDSEGVLTNPAVAPADGEPVIEKNFPNSFRSTGLDAELKAAGVDKLVVAGAMSHMCIDASTRAAADLGYGCTVAADACATRDLAFGDEAVPAAKAHAAFMAALGQAYAAVVTTEEAVSELGGPSA